MPIVTCPGCGHGISDRASTCVNCGSTLVPVATAVAEASAPAAYTAPATVREITQDELPFFAVATHKFVVMCVVTIGLYQYYWLYKQWRRLARMTIEPISPFWRTFFAPLWAFSMFARIEARAHVDKITPGWNDIVLGIAYLVLNSVWRLPDPWWLVSLLAFVPLVPVQLTLEAINAKHAAGPLPNRRYSRANVAGIVLGGVFLVLVLLGTFMKG